MAIAECGIKANRPSEIRSFIFKSVIRILHSTIKKAPAFTRALLFQWFDRLTTSPQSTIPKFAIFYTLVIASDGHTSTHFAQSSHLPASIM